MFVGIIEGIFDDCADGFCVANLLGIFEIVDVGIKEGKTDGCEECKTVGILLIVGDDEGKVDGFGEGFCVGVLVGLDEGNKVGR